LLNEQAGLLIPKENHYEKNRKKENHFHRRGHGPGQRSGIRRTLYILVVFDVSKLSAV
jgi:hypothetical protein